MTGGSYYYIYSQFRERSCSNSAKNAPVFEVLAMELLPRDSASPEDCSHVGTLQVFGDYASLKATFRVDAFYELMLYLLWGEVDVKGKKAELTARFVWSCLFLHAYKTPSAFLGCRMPDLLDSEAGGDALPSCSVTSCRRDSRRRSCRHDSRSRSWTSEFWREPKEKLRRLLVEQRRLQRWINSEVHVLHCSL